jgi:hypothetical protein
MAGWFGNGKDAWQPPLNNRQVAPAGVALLSDGTLLIADPQGNRVMRMTTSGSYLGWIGSGLSGWQMGGIPKPGLGDAQFNQTWGIVVDAQDNIYVGDAGNNRVQKWTSSGVYVGWIGGGVDGWHRGAAPAAGSGDRQFDDPLSVAIDPQGNLWVTDMENSRLQKWTLSGTYLGWVGGTTNGLQTGAAPAQGDGTTSAFSNFAFGLGFDHAGNLYVADCGLDRVVKWDSGYNYVGWIGNDMNGWQSGPTPLTSTSTADGYLYCAYNVNVGPDNSLYISNETGTVDRWSPAGTFEGRFGSGNDGWYVGATSTVNGSGDRYVNVASAVAIDAAGDFYVADVGNGRVDLLDSTGHYRGWIGGGLDGIHTGIAFPDEDYMYEPKIFGENANISLDAAGNYYVSDLGNSQVTKWSSSGIYLGAIGNGVDGWSLGVGAGSGSDDKYLYNPLGLAVDSSGNVYVADSANNRVQKWSSSGTYVGWIGGGVTSGWQTGTAPSAGTGDAAFYYPANLAVSGTNLYVGDRINNRVQKWSIASGGAAYVGWMGGGSSGWQTGTAPAAAATDASFNVPGGMDLDASGNLYVVDVGNSRIQKWTLPSATYVGWIGGSDGWQTGTAPATGNGDRQFSFSGSGIWDEVSQVAVDKNNGTIYVLDTGNARIQSWTSAGAYVGWVGRGDAGWSRGAVNSYVSQTLTNEISDYCGGLAVGPDGTVYLSDGWAGNVTRWK